MAIHPVVVEGPSMLPTLRSGDRLAIRPLRDGEPKTGQIVCATVRGTEVVKRVSAVDGDAVVLVSDNPEARSSLLAAPVDKSKVTGVVFLRYWPPPRIKRFG